MPFLEVTIKSKAELAGFEAANAALERQVGAAKAAGKAHDELDARIAANKKTIADYQAANSASNNTLGQAAAVQTGAAAAAAKYGVSLEKLNQIFVGLNGVVPGLGILMQAAFSPIGAAISIAVTALALFRSRTAEVNAELQRMEEEAAKPLDHRLEAMREHAISGAVAMGTLEAGLAKAARAQETLKTVTDRTIEALKEHYTQAATLADAVYKNNLAGLEMVHKAGLISEDQYNAQRLAKEIKFQRDKASIEQEAELAKIQAHEQSIKAAEGKQADLDKKAKQSEGLKGLIEASIKGDATLPETTARKEAAEKASREFLDKLPKGRKELFESVGAGAPTDKLRAAYLKSEREKDPNGTFSDKFIEDQWESVKNPVLDQYNKFTGLEVGRRKLTAQWTSAVDKRKRKELDLADVSRQAEEDAANAREGRGYITEENRGLAREKTLYGINAQTRSAVGALNEETMRKNGLAGIPAAELAQEMSLSPQAMVGQTQQAFRHGNLPAMQNVEAALSAKMEATMNQIGVAKQEGNRLMERFFQNQLNDELRANARIQQLLSIAQRRNANRPPQ